MERSPYLVSGMMAKVVTTNTPTDGLCITMSDNKGKIHGPFIMSEKIAKTVYVRLGQLLGYDTVANVESYTTSPVDSSAPDPCKSSEEPLY